MNTRTIFITRFDLDRLEGLLAKRADRDALEDLEEELRKARVVGSQEVPGNVVTMNSRVELRDVDTQETMVVTLVFPNEADIATGKISVFSPVGTAILGYSEGDTIEWRVPAGTKHLKIEKVLYQPEAAGDYHL